MVASAEAQFGVGELFMQGSRQAVRLPEQFHLEGSIVRIRRDGDALVIEPLAADGEAVADAWARIDALREGEDLFESGGYADAPCEPDAGVNFDK
jgi:antitoxin VapB